LARYIARKLQQGYGVKELLKPIRRELVRVSGSLSSNNFRSSYLEKDIQN